MRLNCNLQAAQKGRLFSPSQSRSAETLRSALGRRKFVRQGGLFQQTQSPDHSCASSRNRRDRSPPWLLASESDAGIVTALCRGDRARPRRTRGSAVVADASWIIWAQGSTVTSTNAGMLSAPFLSVTLSLNRKSLGSDTNGARNEAFGMFRSKSGTFAPRTWLQL